MTFKKQYDSLYKNSSLKKNLRLIVTDWKFDGGRKYVFFLIRLSKPIQGADIK